VEAAIAWEVIPGVSSGVAAAAYAGIPLLHRSHASSVAFVTGHAGHEHAVAAQGADTLVIFMGGSTILQIARELMESGRAPSTPLALIHSGTRPNQTVYTGTLMELARMERIELASPVLAVVGDVTALADKLHWFGQPPRPLRLLAASEMAAAHS
jgi:siroheme synthase